MDTTLEQLQAAKDLGRFIDTQAGGAGRGYYRIVYTPAQARRVIADGKMAAVLGRAFCAYPNGGAGSWPL